MNKYIKILIVLGFIGIFAVFYGYGKYTKNQENARKEEINILKEQINELIKKPVPKPQIIENTITMHNTKMIDNTRYTGTNEPDLASIIKEWTPRVAFVACRWNWDGIGTGSATMASLSGKIYAMTNRHVIDSNGYVPNKCIVSVENIGNFDIDWINGQESPYGWGDLEDYGYIRIDNLTSQLASLVSSPVKLCYNVNIGDKLVILGYPTIGSQDTITATEGIIAGVEQNYYVTSAKIEHGNSGGAAILLKDDCWLGIPSAAQVGSVESMGRILKANFVIRTQ